MGGGGGGCSTKEGMSARAQLKKNGLRFPQQIKVNIFQDLAKNVIDISQLCNQPRELASEKGIDCFVRVSTIFCLQAKNKLECFPDAQTAGRFLQLYSDLAGHNIVISIMILSYAIIAWAGSHAWVILGKSCSLPHLPSKRKNNNNAILVALCMFSVLLTEHFAQRLDNISINEHHRKKI